MEERHILTTGEVAKYCGVNFRTVIRWIKGGHLRAFQLPGRGDNRIEVDDFVRFLQRFGMAIPQQFQNHVDRSSIRVLIVDDESAMATAIQRVLRKAGYETMTASDGFRAGLLLGTFAPAVITMDLKMPEIGGLDVIKLIRRTEKFKEIKILVLSAMPREEQVEALKAGADDFLEKPFNEEDLTSKIFRLARPHEPNASVVSTGDDHRQGI